MKEWKKLCIMFLVYVNICFAFIYTERYIYKVGVYVSEAFIKLIENVFFIM